MVGSADVETPRGSPNSRQSKSSTKAAPTFESGMELCDSLMLGTTDACIVLSAKGFLHSEADVKWKTAAR